MDGLIVKKPYAKLIIDGKKEWELRSKCPPAKNLRKDLYLLSSGKILGKIRIDSYCVAAKQELEKNIQKHCSDVSFLSEYHESYVWKICITEKFLEPKKYAHPMGARVWVKNVSFVTQPSITNFT